jgi:hypothetical protein
MAEYLTVDQAVVGSTPIRHPNYGDARGLFDKRPLLFSATLQQPIIRMEFAMNTPIVNSWQIVR